ncbi:MAG TPA: deaminase [Bryobacterales bacterium]|nr:deaminase [Bryobacterales bacterium]
MVIGLTGANGAGKTLVCDYLRSRGFTYHSLSDEIREELARRNDAATRENLIDTGNQLRRSFGPAVLAERVKAKLTLGRNYVIDSVRNPSEVEALRRLPEFHLLHIDAPLELRYRRARERRDARAPATFEEFAAQEQREMDSADPAAQQLRATFDLADERLLNDSTQEALYARIDEIVRRRSSRPGWDEYFMRIASIVALRSNCMKRKVAAIIVKDRRIISTGYNGTPRGVRNCNEGGCPRCNSLAPSGTALEECFCSHGEENAIVQAAYHGISLKDSTLYSTFSPCLICTKMIINAGIREVVYNNDYPLNQNALRLLAEAGIQARQITCRL